MIVLIMVTDTYVESQTCLSNIFSIQGYNL